MACELGTLVLRRVSSNSCRRNSPPIRKPSVDLHREVSNHLCRATAGS